MENMNKTLKRIFNPTGVKHNLQKNLNRIKNPKKTWAKIKRLTFHQWLRLLWRSFIVFLFIIVLIFIWYSKDLPTLSKLKNHKTAESTQIYDREGNLLYAISGEKQRIFVPLSDIPDNLKNAVVATEDRDFYQHHGFDVRGVGRAVYYNLLGRKVSQGGSTITQQYVKNALLTSKRTYSRKIKELILSLEIEAIYSKEKILELYLNEIPLGSTAYGVESGSQRYFGKSVKELSLEESASLAALIQAPTYYSPHGDHVDKLLARKNYVVNNMLETKKITPEEADKAKKQEPKFTTLSENLQAPHFIFYIREYLTQKYGEQMMEEGGLRVTTTLDAKAQKMAEDAVNSGEKKLSQYNANNAALVAIDPQNGQIIAMVGSRDYFNNGIDGQVNVTTSLRQPGSSFKPIVYATAFKGKYNPASILFDLKTDFGNYSPDNYDGSTHGPVTMRFALANSLNIPAVKALSLAGIPESIQTAENLGITTLTQPDRYGLSLVLGGGEVKPLEMAGAFGVFANEGKKAPITGILKVTNSKGDVLEEFKDDAKEVLDPQVAFLVNSVMSDTETRRAIFGSLANNLMVPGKTVGAKTGTTQEFHDAWTVGYSRQISVAVWTGNTDNTAMKKGADGSVIAAPIWNYFMKNYLKDKDNVEFTQPGKVQKITVDKLSNKLPTNDSPETISDYFASWQIPKKEDDIHVRVKINKTNGKLATEYTPENLIEEKLYSDVHSERPDNSSWEGPVRAWAEQNNMVNKAPTDKDDMYASLSDTPAVTITAPQDKQALTGNTSFTAEANAKFGIAKVVFAIDNVQISEDTESPFSIDYDLNKLSAGDHTLTVFGYDPNNAVASKQVQFSVLADTAGPTLSNITISTISGATTIAFTTSEPSTGYVKYGTTTTALNSKSLVEASALTSHSISLGGLTAGTLYYFQIVSTDVQGNPATSATYNFTAK